MSPSTRTEPKMLPLLIALISIQPLTVGDTLRWTPEVSMQFRSISDAAVSPDGHWVAYTVTEPVMDGEKSEYLTHIHLVRSDGSDARQFTRGEKSSRAPAFSPDGSHLTFLSNRDDKTQIWIIRVNGGEARRLSDAENGVQSYMWSHDGTRIAYTMTDPETGEEKKAKDEKRWVERVDRDYRMNHLYVLDVEAFEPGDSRQITAGDFTVTGFDWSPDDRTIAFSHAPSPDVNDIFEGEDLSTVPSDSGAVAPLVIRPGTDAQPRYAHDGATIAFVSSGGSEQWVGRSDLYLVDAAGGTPRPLAHTFDRSPSMLGWSADDGRLIVTEASRTTTRILAVPADGADVQPVSDVEGVLGAATLGPAGDRLAFTFETVDVPEELHTSSLDAFDTVRLSTVNVDVAQPPMGRTEVLQWTSPDGREIEGLVTYPVGYVAGTQVPLVLQIHGGPAGVFSQTFTGGPGIYLTQVFAQNGYAVLRPNPRGSTGYGAEFRYANVQDWGYGDWDDVESGVDALIARGVAHPDSLLLMGWSYGGYMTSFGVTRTDRFKAASMGAGLPNLVSMVSTSDIPGYLVAHMGGEYWEDYARYERHSAIYRIANVSTPTQVIHGENDVRVPTDQGREFYVSLKRRGIPTEFNLLPRTPHGPREPKLLMAVTPMILEWFEKHLGRTPTR